VGSMPVSFAMDPEDGSAKGIWASIKVLLH
jgi:hypothetical protein